MNLADMAEHVCETVRKTDSDAVAACKGFIQRRDQMLWDKYLWRDSILEFSKTIDPTAAYVTPLSGTIKASLLTNTGIYLLPRCIDRVLGARLTDRPLPVQNIESYFRQSLDAFAETGTPLEFSLLGPACWQNDVEQTIYVAASDAADTGVSLQVRYLDINLESKSVTISLTTSNQQLNLLAILGVSKPATTGVVYFRNNDDSLNTAVYLGTTDTNAEPMQRVRFTPCPTEEFTVRMLVKQKYLALVGDYEEPRLRQAENVLIALATGDMFVRSGQVGAANQFYAEGMALLQQLGNIEFHQQANRQRLVPMCEPDPLRDRGYTGAFSGKGYW